MTAGTRRICLIGWPAKHSRSPKLHGYWLARHRIAGAYGIEEVPPDAFSDFVANLAARGYFGANVTLPHKEAALAETEPDERARAVGAANTLWFEGGRLRSTNTDVEGFVAALDAASSGWAERAREAVVFGAGGAARAVVFGLLERGIRTVHVVNRTPARAEALRAAFGSAVSPAPWADGQRLIAGAGLVVNATSLGVKGNPELAVDLAPLAPGALVADINYVPLKSALLRAAEARGCAISTGLDMLLFQAVRCFALWFGLRPEVTPELRALIAADIGR